MVTAMAMAMVMAKVMMMCETDDDDLTELKTYSLEPRKITVRTVRNMIGSEILGSEVLWFGNS
eukprot:8255491-Lingulodinium_polyedra.AAC.1